MIQLKPKDGRAMCSGSRRANAGDQKPQSFDARCHLPGVWGSPRRKFHRHDIDVCLTCVQEDGVAMRVADQEATDATRDAGLSPVARFPKMQAVLQKRLAELGRRRNELNSMASAENRIANANVCFPQLF